ncbi:MULTISPECIES: fumarylacetoacetate hydrolase family protein [unclassified Sedimentibacter]|uniref:fumarylacetoacetate hydrolase family protein n=1 Tax=unclassified Sedimentibacter TaxID=2649220 RepID=UPI0027DEC5CD|nr:fumarylacetoacetate hydrolase family protein [Sedimentibacter sp. MB35-C1]WMJ75709.1 fumarylacetoacetate hydrolase family protein [Sedimentibacter sp. MB35-C1]
MYILTYFHENKEHIGFLSENRNEIIPAEAVFKKLNFPVPSNMLNLIDTFDQLDTAKLNDAIASSDSHLKIEDVNIMAPIPYPRRNVLCLGKNYVDHVNEVGGLRNVNSDIPKKPIYFSKIAYPAVGHNDEVIAHSEVVKELDYEVELAVIIGKECKDVSREEAESVIFGYTIANDISARDMQQDHMQWHKGKSLDTYCPMGPYIVPKSCIPFPPNLEIKSYVNGELRQNANTNQLIFDIPEIISDLSAGITLYPGDIILTGTPAGVGAGFKPPKYLSAGDTVDCTIEKIGTLSNTIK